MSNVIQFPGATEGTPSVSNPNGISHPITIMSELIDRGKTFRVPTNWRTFDDASNGGFIYGHCTFICGAPNSGKTAMLACLTDHWINQGIPVGAFMVDEDREDFFMRWATMLGFNMTECDDRSKEMLEKVGAYLNDKPLRILGRPNTIESAAVIFAQEFPGQRIVMVNDSLQRIKSTQLKGNMSERQIATTNAEALETVAKERQWAVVATSEVARAGYLESKEFNDMSAGKNSGDIEYIAKAQLVVRADKNDNSIRKVTVPKIKRGKRDQTYFYLRFNRDDHTLIEIEEVESPSAQLDYHRIKSFFERNNWEFVGSRRAMHTAIGGNRADFFDLLRIMEADGTLHFIYSDKKFVWDINKR